VEGVASQDEAVCGYRTGLKRDGLNRWLDVCSFLTHKEKGQVAILNPPPP